MVPDPAGLAAVDITNPQTWNRYAYLANNPLNAIDPKGLYCAVGLEGGTLRGCTQGAGGFWWGPGEFEAMTLPVIYLGGNEQTTPFSNTNPSWSGTSSTAFASEHVLIDIMSGEDPDPAGIPAHVVILDSLGPY